MKESRYHSKIYTHLGIYRYASFINIAFLLGHIRSLRPLLTSSIGKSVACLFFFNLLLFDYFCSFRKTALALYKSIHIVTLYIYICISKRLKNVHIMHKTLCYMCMFIL